MLALLVGLSACGLPQPFSRDGPNKNPLLAPTRHDTILTQPAPSPAPPVIALLDIRGAPGDGAVSLRRAMDFALSKQDLEITHDLTAETTAMVLIGDVQVTDAAPLPGTRRAEQDKFERVRITWTVLDTGGAVLGTIRQDSRVVKGSLHRHWGTTAIRVTQAAATGIARLVRRSIGPGLKKP